MVNLTVFPFIPRSRSSSSSAEPQKALHGTPSSHKGSISHDCSNSHEGSNSNKRVMFSGVSDGESPSESQNDVWVLRQDDVKDQIGSDSLLSDDSIPVTGVVIARPMCRPVVVPTPQYVLARVETHPTPSQVPNSMHQSLGSPMTSVGMPVSSCSPRKMPVMTTTTTTSTAVTTTMPFPRTCAVPPVRPPPPPPPPRTTPVVTGAGASSVRPPNPVLQRPSLQQRGNFHESPGAI